MLTDFKSLKLIVSEKIAQALVSLAPNGLPSADELSAMLEYPPDTAMGDLALPCFKLAKTLRKGPPMIAAAIKDNFKCDFISKVETAGGYLNMFIDTSYFTKTLLDGIIEAKNEYGRSNAGEGKTIVLDYSSPNVAKPFHIGHLGTTVIGHSIRLMYEFFGYKTVAVNHLGDWGTQFGKLMVAYRKWGDKAAVEEKQIDELVALYVRFHKEAEADPSLEDLARAEFTKLEQGDEDNLALWKWFIEISIKEYKKTYAQLGIEFDYYMGESFYIDKMQAQIDYLGEKGLLKVDNGATIVDLEEYNMPPCIILKSDGSTIYHTRDIAAAVYRKNTYDFDKCVYVTSSGQCLHFAQLFKVIELMGHEWYKDMVHVPYGTVSINGAKLATRTGNVVLLKDLFAMAEEKVLEIIDQKNPDLENKEQVAESVGVGAIVFNYLMNGRIKDTNFILEDALSFDGNTGPYAQYTHARCCSIIEKAGGIPEAADYEATAPELELLRVLAQFPERVEAALTDYEPSYIVRYILDVCAAFNRFYHDCKILTAEEENAKAFRIRLSAATKYTLENALALICLKAPEKI